MVSGVIQAWQPNPTQTLLLRAATGEGEAARLAWRQWIETTKLANLDSGSQRLLPLLYRNLQKLGEVHPATQILGLHYRRAWSLNQLAMRHLEEVLAAFAAASIPTLILKGAAMLARYSHDRGTRPMADFDVLVPTAQTNRAIAVLLNQGWIGHKPLHLLSDAHRTPFHGIGYVHPKKAIGCDLHWHVMHMHLASWHDKPFWDASVPLTLGRTTTRTLCAADQLMHILFNGSVNEGGENLRWLPDALLLLRQAAGVDWAHLVAQCQRLEFVQPAAAMLDYLRTTWEMPVPAEAVEALAQSKTSWQMHKAYEYLNTRKEERSGWQTFWLLYTQYQLAQHGSQRVWPLGFLQFLSHRWSLRGGLQSTLQYAWHRTRGVEAARAKQLVEQVD